MFRFDALFVKNKNHSRTRNSCLAFFFFLDLRQAQLGLGHSYSRAKVKFNVHRVDNMIVQSIALLDQLDKDVNTFAMRVRYRALASLFLSLCRCCFFLFLLFVYCCTADKN